MSLSQVLQPGRSCQDSQLQPKTMQMPWEVEVSTAKSIPQGLGGLWRIEEQLVFVRVFYHHPVSTRTGTGTDKCKKGDLVAENSEVKQERDGK